jgi:hypothetical protein
MKQCLGLREGWKIYSFFGLFLGVLFIAVHLLWAPAAFTDDTAITLLHTNNVTGHLFACPT